MGDPRAPVIPLGIEVDTENYVVNAAGEIRRAYNVILKEEDVGRIREGYVCAKCFEVQDKPFPKRCAVCKFPMSERQAEFVAKGFRGNVRMGPQSTLETETAAMNEWAERRRRDSKDEILRPTQIVLPGRDF